MAGRVLTSESGAAETPNSTGQMDVAGETTTPAYGETPTMVRAADLLRMVHQMVAVESGSDDPLTMAALHLICCATDVVTLLPGGDLPSAREALGCARAAVGAATYAIRQIHDRL
jgi:hypothetical protein